MRGQAHASRRAPFELSKRERSGSCCGSSPSGVAGAKEHRGSTMGADTSCASGLVWWKKHSSGRPAVQLVGHRWVLRRRRGKIASALSTAHTWLDKASGTDTGTDAPVTVGNSGRAAVASSTDASHCTRGASVCIGARAASGGRRSASLYIAGAVTGGSTGRGVFARQRAARRCGGPA
jgi:hypothetical protein